MYVQPSFVQPQAVLPPQPVFPSSGGVRFTPNCPQYSVGSGAIVPAGPSSFFVNCSANSPTGDPTLGPYDGYCTNGMCYEMKNNQYTGRTSNTVDTLCCLQPAQQPLPLPYPVPYPVPVPPYPGPGPGPRPQHPCCNRGSVNDCARCLDNMQGLGPNDSSGHFGNMLRCRNMCRNF